MQNKCMYSFSTVNSMSVVVVVVVEVLLLLLLVQGQDGSSECGLSRAFEYYSD